MFERQRLQTVVRKRGADLVVGELQLLRSQRHRVFEPGENEDVARPLLADQRPGERDGATHERGVTGLACIGVGQRRRDATVFECLELCIDT